MTTAFRFWFRFLASFPAEWRVNETFLSVFQTLYHHHRDMCSRCSRYRKGHWKCSSYNGYDWMSTAFCKLYFQHFCCIPTFIEKSFRWFISKNETFFSLVRPLMQNADKNITVRHSRVGVVGKSWPRFTCFQCNFCTIF